MNLLGDDGSNTFIGNAGNDTFTVGRGYDSVSGAEGVDHFIIERGGVGDIVTINDFDPFSGEKIDLSAFDDLITTFNDLTVNFGKEKPQFRFQMGN